MAQDIRTITDTFALLDDWEERYKYLIDLGKTVQPLSADEKRDDNLVKGCTSRVWLIYHRDGEGASARHHYRADSDAHIVRGLIALLLAVYDGRTASEIMAADIKAFFTQLGLDQHLSPNRRSGFFSMVERIQNSVQ